MPESRVQLRIEVEIEGAEQLTTLRQELDRLAQTGTRAATQLDSSFTAVLDKLRLAGNVLADSTRNFLDSQRQLFAGLAPMFDAFFRNVFTGARSLRDSLKRLWQQFLEFFLDIVRQMLTAWFGALQAMTGARSPAFGPGIGGLLGSIFGLLGLSPLSSIPAGGLSLLSAGLGGVLPIFPHPASAGAFGLTALTGLLAGGGLLTAIAGVSRGSPLPGGLGGFLLGGSIGLGVAGAGLGGAIGAFAGPIGAIAGLFIGSLLGIFRRGKLKRQAARIADEGFAAMQQVIREFERFQIDFESATARVTAIWSEMVATWERMGKIGERSIRGQQPFFAQVLQRLQATQRAREQHAQLIAALPIPEFQLGGLVRPESLPGRAFGGSVGGIVALLHAGEAVLNRRAVAALGERRIEELNRGPERLVAGHSGRGALEVIWSGRMEDLFRENRVALVRFIRRERQDGVL